MLIDARTLELGTTADPDVCIIGAGAAGITIAMELLDSGLSVLLLESGGATPDAATQDLYAGESVGQPLRSIDRTIPTDEVRLRYFGGTTNHWAGACRPLTPVDFEERDGLRVSGWPIEHADLLPYWERAVDYVRITDAEFDPSVWADRVGPDLPPPPPPSPVMETSAFQVTFPTSFNDLYGAALATAPADVATVWQWANVVNLAMEPGPGGAREITGVDVRTLAGGIARVTARAYVLATGGIENARLLLASTDRDPAGVGNSTDQVGRYFCEHMQIYAGFGVLEGEAADLLGFQGAQTVIPDGPHAGFPHGVKYALTLTDDHVRAEGVTGMEIQMIVGPYPASTWSQEQGATVEDVAALLRTQDTDPGGALYLQALAEQELDPESRVGLGDDTDALGMRRIRLDWRHSLADRERAWTNLRTMGEEFGAQGLGRFQLIPGGVGLSTDTADLDQFLSIYAGDPSATDRTDFPVGVGFHHMCSTRMAADPQQGVVDADCRVHDLDNLWVAGSSVFATPGTATPTFTIVALATRLADHLRSVLS